MPTTASTTAMTTSSLLLLGSENPAPALAGPGEEDDQQHDVDDAAGEDVEPDAGHRLRRRDARLLQVAHVERHPADVGRRDPVDERRGQLGLRRSGTNGSALGHAADHADRRPRRRSRRTSRRRPASQPQFAERSASHAVVDVGELRQQEVEGAGERGDHDDRARPHPDEALERLGFLRRSPRRSRRASRLSSRLRGLPAGRRRERQRLQVRRRGGQLRPGRARGRRRRSPPRTRRARRARRAARPGRSPAAGRPPAPRRRRGR